MSGPRGKTPDNKAPRGGSPRAGRPGPRRGSRAAPPDGGRRRALAVLLEVERGAWASERLTADDPPFVRELVLGVLRRRATLDAVHDAYSRRTMEELEPSVRAALRLGLLQYLFLDGVPPHAIANETVRLLAGGPESGGRRAYVNGVLRAVLRESRKLPEGDDRGGASETKRLHRPGRTVTFFARPVFPDPARDRTGWLAAVHSHPRFLVERWLERVGEEPTLARLLAGNAHQPLVLRPRLGRIDAATLVGRLRAEEVLCETLARQGGPDGVVVAPGRASALATRAFRDGLFSVQDAAQRDAAEILAPQRGETVWDACAAPGGKATQLAELLAIAGGGTLVATDASEARLPRLRENLARLKLEGVAVAAHDLLSDAPPPGRPAAGFDAILLDAPCSNTAVLARRPEARWRLRPETFDALGALQRALLAAAARHLAPHGRLVYSVCTHEPEEGEDHGLQFTRTPFVFSANAAELNRAVGLWEAAGMLGAPPPPAAGSDELGEQGDAGDAP